MTKNNPSPEGELSYYGLSLLAYLRDSHPDKAGDKAFITGRADRAAEAYSQAIRNGLTHVEAEELANAELHRGLHFSVYNTLVNILWDEFSAEISEDNTRKVSLQVLPLTAGVLAKYTLTDDFADTPAYDLLYTELTGTIQIFLEDGAV
ncbi:MAG: DUF1896 domain-containing protein [Massilibacteroides sp.]|nr:DUF1896 domain-containing protein [Massilibacteroides sp.]